MEQNHLAPAVGKPAPQFCIITVSDSSEDMDAVADACNRLKLKVWLLGKGQQESLTDKTTSFRIEYTHAKDIFNLGIVFQSLKQQ